MNRRDFVATSFLATMSFTGGYGLNARPPQKRPNIMVFLVDDMGWQDTSVDFAEERAEINAHFRTPNMERLAAGGMKFTNAYACSVCSPSRISFMTGMNAARHRVTDWTLHADGRHLRRHPSLELPRWNYAGLSSDPNVPDSVHARTLAELLQDAGYLTIHVGKAHLGAIDKPGADPLNLGFDINIAGHAGGAPGSYYSTHRFANSLRRGQSFAPHVMDVPGLEEYHDQDINLTEVLTLEAMKEIDKAVQEDKPFFMHLSHYTVHTPIMPDPRFIDNYSDLDQREAAYASMVEAMDKSLGDMLEHLDQRGLTENTFVIFLSDNGGLTAHSRGGPGHMHNAPLASGKGSALEGGTRVPMLVRWPSKTEPGSVCHVPTIIEDCFPTLLEVAGVAVPNDLPQKVDGISVVPLLKGDEEHTDEERLLVWHYPNWWGPRGPGIDAYSSAREGPWKLIYYHADRSYALYNLDDDIGEANNLAESMPEKKRELANALAAYLRSVDAQMPADRETGEVVPYP